MTGRTAIACVLIFVFGIALPHDVRATMGGVTNVGAFLTPIENSTATREWIKLEESGGLLTAKPDHDLLEMITVYAPGIRHGHLILRELKTREGKRTLLLTAPDAVMAHVQRATLYIRGLQDDIVLFENVLGVWEKRLPQALVVASIREGGTSTQTLRAFSVKALGFYWLLEPATATTFVSHTPETTSARTLMGGGVTWGLLPSIFGIVLFMVFGALSRWIHKTPKFREQ